MVPPPGTRQPRGSPLGFVNGLVESCSVYASSFITYWLDKLFECLGMGAHKNALAFQGCVCLINIVLSIHPLFCHLTVLNSLHVVFWLGKGPMYVNLAVPVTLFLLNIGVAAFQLGANAERSHEAKKGHAASVPPPGGYKGARTQMGCFLLFLILGSMLMGFGAYVMKVSRDTSEDLIHSCGSTPMTMRLEQEWNKLETFFEMCKRHLRRAPDYVQQCPFYGRTFPNRVFANYLEDLESDFNCVGFCKFWAKPLFNPDSDRGVRCASALGEELVQAGNIVGFPTFCTGLVLAVVGICLRGYENL